MYYTVKYILILLLGGFFLGSLLIPFVGIVVSLPGGFIASKAKSKTVEAMGFLIASIPNWLILLYWTAFVVSFVHRQSARGKGIAFILWIVAFFVALTPYRHAAMERDNPLLENLAFITLRNISFLVIPVGFFVFFFFPSISEWLFYYLPLFDPEP